ncbi:MAG: alpha/beta hydrolase [Anaerolineae bacterium]|jgi:pimeloyl-ACP methyl ester carboxylesterase|nr:alpha/beta hydrolase [Anaerolineae bacterium]
MKSKTILYGVVWIVMFGMMYVSVLAQYDGGVETQYVQTSVLNIAYEVQGRADGTPIILLHGFPDDIRSWDGVIEGVVSAGFRTYAPYLRGYGLTSFLEDTTPRVGQNGALVQDVIEFADALGLSTFILVGHDWGAQAAQGVAALYPERVTHLVSFAPYSLTWDDYQQGFNYPQIQALWYQSVLNQPIGEGILYADAKGFARYLWQTWSPSWEFSDDVFEATAISFMNPDFVPVVLQAYRGSYGLASNDPRYDAIEAQLAQRPPITVNTTVLLGADDGINIFMPYMLEQTSDFSGGYTAKVYDGVGHFIHRENPQVVIDAILAIRQS